MARMNEEFPGVEWIDGTGEFIKIVEEKCTGCANCVKICMGGCFEIKNKKSVIKSLKNCMECMCCSYICEENAIIFNWPKGGTGYRSDWG